MYKKFLQVNIYFISLFQKETVYYIFENIYRWGIYNRIRELIPEISNAIDKEKRIGIQKGWLFVNLKSWPLVWKLFSERISLVVTGS